MTSLRFLELRWLLQAEGGVVVFCRTIAFGFRVAAYLYHEAKKSLCAKQVRMFNSLNWSSYNAATLAFLNDNPAAQIIVATDTLSVGFDSPNIKTVVIFGETMDTDDYLQKVGCIRISRPAQSSQLFSASAITYLSRMAVANAKIVLEGKTKPVKSSHASPKVPQLSTNMARLIVAPCKVEELNKTYDNPISDIPCTCSTCSMISPPSCRSAQCSCTGCSPEPHEETPHTAKKQSTKGLARLSAEEKQHGQDVLTKLRDRLWQAAMLYSLPPTVVMPDTTISHILSHHKKVHHLGDLQQLTLNPHLVHHQKELLPTVLQLQNDFKEIWVQKKAKRMGEGRARGSVVDKGDSSEEVLGESDKSELDESDQAEPDIIVPEGFYSKLDDLEAKSVDVVPRITVEIRI
ncbi:hypothetical protein PAXINDRAFT_16332 [Paxillus involutus ATCC 200175]|uniref:Helicase C-terminal domain-containing protein n=1 Tax=Paxillus involutus ATCC 200175 TaxID=664439 RepID=A0A0C9TU35_PAXIN|nr:hypothetical protein PAXINDRAFT_16332 [Paxillus involutus ATCC 200175]